MKGVIYSIEYTDIVVDHFRESLRSKTSEVPEEGKKYYGVVGNNLVKLRLGSSISVFGEFGESSLKLKFVLRPVLILNVLLYLFLSFSFVSDPYEDINMSQFNVFLIALGFGCIFILQFVLLVRRFIKSIDEVVGRL